MGATAPTPGLEFTVSLDVRRDQQPHHDARIDALLRVEAVGIGPRDEVPAVELAVVIALDVAAARREAAAAALAAALRALPDGVSFTVLGGADASGEPTLCYPLRSRWALADTMEKRRAAFSAGRIAPAAGDRPPPGYPAWLAAARTLFAERPLPVRHLLLITDGSGRDPADPTGPGGAGTGALRTELTSCEGAFTADVLAVGGGWDPAPLLAVVESLHGTAEPAPDRFGPAVTGAVRRLRRVRSPELPVVVWARGAVRAVELTEIAPREQRLEPEFREDDPRLTEFPTYQWEPGDRNYRLTVHADASADPLGVLLQLATVRVGDAVAALLVRWQQPGVAVGAAAAGSGGHLLQTVNAATRMRTALIRGYAALDPLIRDEAERQLGLAVRLATEIDAAWVLQDVGKVADIVDRAGGVVRVGPTVDHVNLRVGRLKTASGHPLKLPVHAAGKPVPCPHCGHLAGPGAPYCISCGKSL
ncbi:hypothetical protein [Streptomyces sp. NPDC059651]|uniref:hypothetical protein n=1 Tax=Streptomyces sp. NPDC059651 TaxID=3346897 RepID=UPI0036B54428